MLAGKEAIEVSLRPKTHGRFTSFYPKCFPYFLGIFRVFYPALIVKKLLFGYNLVTFRKHSGNISEIYR